jgi:predicted porin
MQMKTIALAVAALVSGAAFAQSNVTVYGQADVGYVYSKSDYKKFQGIEDNMGISGGQSRLGVRGEEALGNGLKAVFDFQWGLSNVIGSGSKGGTDIGAGPASARWTYVGLAGNFGTVTVGRNRTPIDLYLGGTAVQGTNGLEPISRFRAKIGGIMNGPRWDNSIAYSSPNFSGLDFAAIYSFGEKVNYEKDATGCSTGVANTTGTEDADRKCADTSDAGLFGLGVRYANGPLYLTAAYHVQADDDSARAYTAPDWGYKQGYGAKGWAIGGTYDFKVVKVYANYYYTKANHSGLAYKVDGAGSDKQTTWSLGLGIPVSSAGTVSVEYAQYKDYLNGRSGLSVDAGPKPTANAGHKSKGYSLGYRHNLSKRTALYTYVSRFDNDRAVNAGWGTTGVEGEKQTNFVLGILHTF